MKLQSSAERTRRVRAIHAVDPTASITELALAFHVGEDTIRADIKGGIVAIAKTLRTPVKSRIRPPTRAPGAEEAA